MYIQNRRESPDRPEVEWWKDEYKIELSIEWIPLHYIHSFPRYIKLVISNVV